MKSSGSRPTGRGPRTAQETARGTPAYASASPLDSQEPWRDEPESSGNHPGTGSVTQRQQQQQKHRPLVMAPVSEDDLPEDWEEAASEGAAADDDDDGVAAEAAAQQDSISGQAADAEQASTSAEMSREACCVAADGADTAFVSSDTNPAGPVEDGPDESALAAAPKHAIDPTVSTEESLPSPDHIDIYIDVAEGQEPEGASAVTSQEGVNGFPADQATTLTAEDEHSKHNCEQEAMREENFGVQGAHESGNGHVDDLTGLGELPALALNGTDDTEHDFICHSLLASAEQPDEDIVWKTEPATVTSCSKDDQAEAFETQDAGAPANNTLNRTSAEELDVPPSSGSGSHGSKSKTFQDGKEEPLISL